MQMYHKKKRKYIKFFKYLNIKKKFINLYIKKYLNLKFKFNKYIKFKYINKNISYYYNNKLKYGILDYLKKNKKINYDFIIEKNNDIRIYDLWNMNPNYIKYVFSNITRKHPYENIYNVIYRTILKFPYSIIVKPYIVIIKSFFFQNILLLFEWKNKKKKDLIILKVIKKYKKYKKNFKKEYFEIFNFFYKKLLIKKINKRKFKYLFNKKIKYLFWYNKNWLWRYKNNFLFNSWNKNISLNYQFLLINNLKLNIIKKYKLFSLPKKVFLEKFKNILVYKLLKKKMNFKNFKKKLYKIKDYLINKNNSFYIILYNLYFYWIIYNIYIYKSYIINIMFVTFLTYIQENNKLLNNKINKLLFDNVDNSFVNKKRIIFMKNIYINIKILYNYKKFWYSYLQKNIFFFTKKYFFFF